MNSLKLNKECLQNFNEFINKKVDEENKIIEFLQSQIDQLQKNELEQDQISEIEESNDEVKHCSPKANTPRDEYEDSPEVSLRRRRVSTGNKYWKDVEEASNPINTPEKLQEQEEVKFNPFDSCVSLIGEGNFNNNNKQEHSFFDEGDHSEYEYEIKNGNVDDKKNKFAAVKHERESTLYEDLKALNFSFDSKKDLNFENCSHTNPSVYDQLLTENRSMMNSIWMKIQAHGEATNIKTKNKKMRMRGTLFNSLFSHQLIPEKGDKK